MSWFKKEKKKRKKRFNMKDTENWWIQISPLEYFILTLKNATKTQKEELALCIEAQFFVKEVK